jgi:hypothetical protein
VVKEINHMILGATKGHHHHIDPYMVMRAGWIPGVMPSGRNLRAGVRHAAGLVHASYPFQTAPLPAPLPVASPAAVPVPAAPATTPSGTAGAFGGFGFGSPGGTRMGGMMDPYMVMRAGVIPGVLPSGRNLRAGIKSVTGYVHGSMPFQTAPLPAPLPVASPAAVPVPAAPATTPSGTKGLMGVLADHLGIPRRRRHWFFNPLAVTAPAPSSCERLGPRSDGLYVTICNGQVTEYSDAAGNSHPSPYTNPGAYL